MIRTALLAAVTLSSLGLAADRPTAARGAEEIGREDARDSTKHDEGIPATEMESRAARALDDSADTTKLRFSLEGGVAGYTGELGASNGAGPLVGVNVGTDWRGLVGVDLGYQASRNSIDDDIAGANQAIQRHNISAFAKVGPTLGDRLRPFVGAGLGASYVNVTDGADEASDYRNDFMQEVPLGAGLEYNVGALQAGLRGQYRVLLNDEFQEPTPGSNNPSGGMLSAALSLGGRF